ncbi:nucleotide exchange factor SIL1 isoform X2 [Cephus cinctus]|uniref:Nucleotide exchange factor SIL1 n=1 Tax=Cephus cinctus TaxID=211228 RepID=A0AAJ7C884_CEPCN|nr:nucleotide exchange factor SIL1 isoform X2 [Cephus cinctus]
MPADLRIFIFFSLFLAVLAVNDGKNESFFVPTHEWQIVKKGTPIPQGLHIKHNFETGITEAKLMNPDDSSEDQSKEKAEDEHLKSLILHPDEAINQSNEKDSMEKIVNEAQKMKLSVKELKSRLKKIRFDDTVVPRDLDNDDARPTSNEGFRNYETLKKEFEALEVNVSNDAEIMTAFMKRFDQHKNSILSGTLTVSEIEDILDILNNLEYLLHQIDNAQVFTDMGGMTKVIYPCLNASNNEVKSEALRLLGAAAQSNPKVQAKALENDFIQKLLHMITTNNKVEVRSRCLFALGALIRNYPAAQKALINHGGLEIFGEILVDGPLQTQTRIMKLINDLITERQNVGKLVDEEQRQRHFNQYKSTAFEEKIVLHNYCKHLSDLLVRSIKHEVTTNFNMEDRDFLEIIYESMITANSVCHDNFVKKRDIVLPALNEMLKFYQSLDVQISPEEDDLFRHLLHLVEIFSTVIDHSHDEL